MLKFDGEFIISYLLNNNFKYITEKSEIEDNTFTTLISDMGQFYSITVYFKKKNKSYEKVTFYDSLKIIPFSVDETAKAFDLPISKLSLDYNTPREKGYQLKDYEKDYIKNDVLIVAKALNQIFQEKLTGMTRAGNALRDYKEILGKNKFEHYFPHLPPEVDKIIRKGYKGGFTYLNPIYKEKDVENVNILDVNSLYPSVMFTRALPIGEPIYYTGKYKEDKVYPLYMQRITCRFKIKNNKIPTIQIKGRKTIFAENEYLESSEDEIISLTLTNVDLKLFLEQYDVEDLEFEDGWKFRSFGGNGEKGLFHEYIEKWTARKIKAGKEGNKGQRQLAKLMLNSLYRKIWNEFGITFKIMLFR